MTDDDRQPIALPLAHARGVITLNFELGIHHQNDHDGSIMDAIKEDEQATDKIIQSGDTLQVVKTK